MEREPPRKKLRKGTQSCMECRRRKVRCTWQNGHESICDGCLARGLFCRSQNYALDHERSGIESTDVLRHDRVSHLNRRLDELVDRVRFLERENARGDIAQNDSGHPSHQRDEASTVGRFLAVPLDDATDLPGGNLTHMRSLFEGAFVEAEGSLPNNTSHAPARSCGISAEHKALRKDLLALLPCDGDFELILHHALDWWAVVDAGVPSISIDSKQELRAVFERLKKPDSDPALIAMWLVATAITIQQVPPDVDRAIFENPAMLNTFPHNIMIRIEEVLATHRAIAATVWGIECSLMLVKLQLNCGRVRSAWLMLRAGIAYAELSGFSEICGSPDILSRIESLDRIVHTVDFTSTVLKASIWIQFCLLERILGVLLGLPTTTRGRPHQVPRYLLRRNGAGRGLFWELSNMAVKIRDRDVRVAFAETSQDWIDETRTIERELQDLARTAGIQKSEPWIVEDETLRGPPEPDPPPLLYQHMYFYLLLRTHLPLMVQTERDRIPPPLHPIASVASSAAELNAGGEWMSQIQRSHALCVYASVQMGRIYLQQTNGPSRGLFPMRISDFMAFTAIAVLLLEDEGIFQPPMATDSSAPTGYRRLSGDARLVEELIAVLEHTAGQEGRVIAAQAVKAVDSIRATLAARGDAHCPGTSIRIPLLGTICVKRKARSVYTENSEPMQGKPRTTRSPLHFSGKVAEPSHDNGDQNGWDPTTMNTSFDQQDWIAGVMDAYDACAASAQDALWLWEDETTNMLS